MSNYIQDPNDSKKQIPGSPPDNYYDRSSAPARCTLVKTPNYVLVTKLMTKPFGFFYGSSASFADLATAGKILGTNYDSDWGALTVGTKLDIHPTAWSGSSDDNSSIKFVYRGGLDGSGRP
jgi:hypothetical protein